MIFETVITTLNDDASCHIAPMGIRLQDQYYVIAPFKPSVTLANLQRCGEAVINMTDDVRIIAGCLSGRYDWPLRPAAHIAGQMLADALSHVEVRVEQIEEDVQRPRFHCAVVYEQRHGGFRGFNRAQAAVVEAAILVSRLDRLPPDKVDAELRYLTIAIEKTAGEKERQAWQWLQEVVADYYASDGQHTP